MAIEYVAYNEAGERTTGILEVESRERAQEVLWASNLVVLRLKKRGQRHSLAQLMPTFFGIRPLDIITFSRELASLLESGITLVPALRILHEQTERGALRDVIRSLIGDVETGISFSQACTKQPTAFPPFYVRLLQVAEETGELRKILLEIIAHMERQRAIASKIRKALTYPSIVVIVGMAAAFVLMTFALPALTGLLTEFQAEIPLTSKMLITLGKISQAYGKYVFGSLVILALLGWQYSRTAPGKKRWDILILKIPIVSRIIHHTQMARLCSSLTTMLSGGVPTAEAIQLSIEATDNSVFREALTQVYREVLTGSRLEPAILKQKVFPRLFSQSVGIGEETGAINVNLKGLATFYEQEADRAATRATEMIEPSIIVLVGLVVGFIGVSIVSAIYSIIPQLK